MELVKKAETALAGVFKNAPKLPSNVKETLVKIWPTLALIFGVLQLLAAWALWDAYRDADKVIVYLGQYLGGSYGYSGMDKVFIILSLITLVINAVLLLMAYPKLAKRQKAGWDLAFIGALLNGLYSVFNLFINGRGFGSFLGALIGSAIAFYLLFQVRSKFTGAVSAKQL